MFRVASVTFRPVLAGRKLPVRQSLTLPNARWNSSYGTGPGALPPKIRTVGYADVKQRTKETAPHVHVIDVREPYEVEQGYIPYAKNIPLAVLRDTLHLAPELFKQKVRHDKPHQHHEIVFYCRSGKRAAAACEIALKNGYMNVMNYIGSWQDWMQREKMRKP